jgi:hypothetical protein
MCLAFGSFVLFESYIVYQLYLMYQKFQTWGGLPLPDKILVVCGFSSAILMLNSVAYGFVVYHRARKGTVKAEYDMAMTLLL